MVVTSPLRPISPSLWTICVESGTYNNASEVVRDGLRELQRRKHADQLTEIQARVGTGLDELDRGEGSSGPPAEVLGGVLMEVKRRLGHK